MSAPKPTPGPWSADKWAPGYTVSAPNSHYSVCHLEDCNNAEANAALIASAPDLAARISNLEALLAEKQRQCDTLTDRVSDLVFQRDNLRAALTPLVNGPVRFSNKSNNMLSEHDPKVIAARAALGERRTQ